MGKLFFAFLILFMAGSAFAANTDVTRRFTLSSGTANSATSAEISTPTKHGIIPSNTQTHPSEKFAAKHDNFADDWPLWAILLVVVTIFIIFMAAVSSIIWLAKCDRCISSNNNHIEDGLIPQPRNVSDREKENPAPSYADLLSKNALASENHRLTAK